MNKFIMKSTPKYRWIHKWSKNAWVRTWDRCRGISNNLSTYSNFLFEYVLKYLVAVTWKWDCRFEYFLRVEAEAEFCAQLCLVAAGPDHKPLETIAPGPLRNDDRLQAMKLRLQKYDITVI